MLSQTLFAVSVPKMLTEHWWLPGTAQQGRGTHGSAAGSCSAAPPPEGSLRTEMFVLGMGSKEALVLYLKKKGAAHFCLNTTHSSCQ